MKKFIRSFLILTLFLSACTKDLSFLTSTERSWLKSLKHPLRVAPDPDFAPFESADKNGIFHGISIDYLKAIEKKLGIRFEIVFIPSWEENVTQTKSRKVDIWSAVASVPSRKQYMIYTPPYIQSKVVFITLTDQNYNSNWHPSEDDLILAVKNYYTYEKFTLKHPHCKISAVDSTLEGLKAVRDKKAKTFISDMTSAQHLIAKYKLNSLKVASVTHIAPLALSFASRNDWPILSDILTKTISNISLQKKQEIINRRIKLKIPVLKKQIRSSALFNFTKGILFIILISWFIFLIFIYIHKNKKIISIQNRFILIGVITSLIFFLILLTFSLIGKYNNTPNLSRQEKEWLAIHKQDLTLAPDSQFAPIEWITSDGSFRGIAADYTHLIEKKLGIRFRVTNIASWKENIKQAQKGEIDMWSAVSSTPQKKIYMNFTKPYFSLKAAFIVNQSESISFDPFVLSNKKIAVVNNYFTHDYLRTHYPHTKIITYPNASKALLAVSFNQADAVFMDLVTASYYITQNTLTTLSVSKILDINYNLSFACRKDLPILLSILNKTIDSISWQEKKNIDNKWLPISKKTLLPKAPLILGFAIFGTFFFLILLIFILWNKYLESQVTQKTKALKKSEETLSLILEESNDGITDFYPDKNIFHFSPRWFSQLGYNPDTMPQTYETFKNLIHPRDLAITEEKLQNYIRHPKGRLSMEFRLKTANDTWKTILARNKAVEISSDGKAYRIISSYIDITTIRQSEQENLKLRTFMNNIIDSIDSALISTDNNFKITHWNRFAMIYFSKSSLEATGHNLFEVLPQMRRFKSQIESSLHHHSSLIIENTSLMLNKNKSQCKISINLMRQNRNPGIIILIDDITEIKEKEHQLNRAQKMETIGILAGGIAHDFNNLLAGIIGTLSLMEFELKQNKNIANQDLQEYIKTMNMASTRARDLVEQLLTLARKKEAKVEAVDLVSILSNIKHILANSIDKSVKLDFQLPSHPCMVLADGGQLEQIFLNLCINGIHAMTIMRPDSQTWGGSLEVRVTHQIKPNNPQNSEYVISFKDQGVGMNSETISKIYTPFFTTKEKGKGSGLGLSIAYSIIKQLNGSIDIKSKENEGSEFLVHLRALETKDKSEENISHVTILPSFDCKKRATVLLIDDEELVRNTASKILLNGGHTVITANNGIEGITLYKKNQSDIDIILLDMVMPEMSGKATFEKLITINPNVKIIMSSGFKNDPRVQETLRKGAKGFLQKPYHLQELLQIIEDTL